MKIPESAVKIKKRNIPYECYNVGCMMPYMDYTPRTLEEGASNIMFDAYKIVCYNIFISIRRRL